MGGTGPRRVGWRDRRGSGRGFLHRSHRSPASPAVGCFVSGVMERPRGCSHRRTGCCGSVSSWLLWSSPARGLRRAPPGRGLRRLSTPLPRHSSEGSRAPFPPRPRVALLLGEFCSSAPWMLASSLLWTLDKPHGDLLAKPWEKKLLRSVFGLSDGACFRIQKGLEGFPACNVGRRPLP